MGMLLNPEQKTALVHKILAAARRILDKVGKEEIDLQTGLVTHQAKIGGFVLIEHQRQQVAAGPVRTNGLDLWQIIDGKGVKKCSVHYVPFELKYVDVADEASWIDTFLQLGDSCDDEGQ